MFGMEVVKRLSASGVRGSRSAGIKSVRDRDLERPTSCGRCSTIPMVAALLIVVNKERESMIKFFTEILDKVQNFSEELDH